MTESELTPDNFKKELKALLKKYDAEIGIEGAFADQHWLEVWFGIHEEEYIDLGRSIDGN